jgi:putative ABC transport system ATP-binding protein
MVCSGTDARPQDHDMIALHGVSKTVTSGGRPLTILHPTDLVVEKGRSVAILGPSGSGKSTLLGLMAGLDQPTSGRILLDGVDVTALGEDALARVRGQKIGFIFQFFHLIGSLTAFENVLVPMELAGVPSADLRARELLDDVGLADRGHHYPSQLSGGEQQRVAIARALANDPPLLLADEPTGNLDTSNGQHIIDLLFDVNRARGTTLVLVTHDRDLASRAEARIVLRDGRITERVGLDAGVAASAGAPAGELAIDLA